MIFDFLQHRRFGSCYSHHALRRRIRNSAGVLNSSSGSKEAIAAPGFALRQLFTIRNWRAHAVVALVIDCHTVIDHAIEGFCSARAQPILTAIFCVPSPVQPVLTGGESLRAIKARSI